MLSASTLADHFSKAQPYAPYLATGKEEHQRRWKAVYDRAQLSPAEQKLVGSFVRQMNILILSGTWCGDCVQQVPLIQRIAEGNAAKIDLRIVDRDIDSDLMKHFRINGGDRVPAVIFMAEDFEFCGLAGDRTLSRYRAIAHRQLGAVCFTGLTPPDDQEISITLSDWVNEFERVQLMLRLSARLRQTHGD